MKIIYEEGNQLHVVHPVDMSLTIEEHAERAVPPGISWRAVPDDFIPPTREWRNAWKAQGDAIEVDVSKAQDITKDRLRKERAPLLEALDVAQIRELGAGRSPAEIEAKKQVLRDLPQVVDGVTDLEALKNLKAEL